MKIRMISFLVVLGFLLSFAVGCSSGKNQKETLETTPAATEENAPEYERIYHMFTQQRLVFCVDEKYGYLDEKGNEVIPAKFNWAMDFYDGLACVMEGDWESGGTWGFIDSNGNYVINPVYSNAMSFNESGLAPVAEGDKWGYINQKGEYVIEPQYEYAFQFAKNGKAQVTVNDKYGYIDLSGDFVIEPKFDDAFEFENGYAAVMIGDWMTGKWGYIDEKGEYLVEPQFEEAYHFTTDGYAMVVKDGKCGLIDRSGNLVVDCKYDALYGNFPGMAEN